jgi:UDP-2,3-diacylglucosamine pyrophosphatase LpxH
MKEKKRRKVELVILSDVHLGTYGCRAKALESYLQSIQPEKIILNGDIIDMWQFSKRYWPKSHMKVLRRFFTYLSKKTEVIYIPGNHDELLRKFVGTKIGRLSIQNKAVLDLEGERVWVFHGDAFDVTMQHSRWLVRLGAIGYDTLILLNTAFNAVLQMMGRSRISFSGRIKASVKKAVSFINAFEDTVARIAIDQGFDTVVCGHIHQPADKIYEMDEKKVRYLNSGDWIENLTSLEYHDGEWTIYRHPEDDEVPVGEDPVPNRSELFSLLQKELQNQHPGQGPDPKPFQRKKRKKTSSENIPIIPTTHLA